MTQGSGRAVHRSVTGDNGAVTTTWEGKGTMARETQQRRRGTGARSVARILLAGMIGLATLSVALVASGGTAGAAALILAPGTAGYSPGGGANTFGLGALISGGTPDAATLSITGQPASGTATASATGYITYTPGAATSGNQVVTYQICTAPATNCGTGTVTFYDAQNEIFGEAVTVSVSGINITEDVEQTLSLGVIVPTNPVAGSTISASLAPAPSVIPSSDSGATLNDVSGIDAIFPIPTGLTYVAGSVGLSGGDSTVGPQTTVHYCTAASSVCTAQTTGNYHTTYPYLEEETNSTYKIPPSTITLPTATAQFTVTGTAGSTIKATVSEFDITTYVTDSGFNVTVPFDGYPAADCGSSGCSSTPVYQAQTLFTTTIAAPPPPPTITGISPATGSTLGGTSVTIAGSNLANATAVDFGSTAATVTADTATSITATAPAGTGTVNVSVTTANGTGTSPTQYVYVAPPPPPTITGISPATGPNAGGTSVTITGTNLANATAVDFGTTATAALADSATSITVNSPAGSGTVDVTVTTGGGTATAPTQFAYLAPPASPVISSISPSSGAEIGGTAVTITGTGLNGATAVDFGSSPGSVTADSATSITVTSPAGSGSVTVAVTTPGGTGTSPSQFTYLAPPPPPTLTGITPSSGPTTGGTAVTLTGTNLANATGVTFGTSPGTVTADTATSITVTSPAGVGSVNVTVSTLGGATAAPSQFTYITPAGFPVVTHVSPAGGPFSGGTVVTITGTNLSYASQVSFGAQPAFFYNVSATSITAVAPAGSGAVDISVTTPSGTSSPNPAADTFTYAAPAPTVNNVSPSSGPATGGTAVTLTGTGLAGASTVDFGTTAGTITADSNTSITVLSPPGTGTVQVTVTVASATSAGAGFTYNATPAPAVTAVAPATGPWSGGTTVTITGTNLWSATGVSFGTQPAFFYGVTATTITAVAPAGSGAVDVTVTTPAGTSPANPSADTFTYAAASPTLAGASPSSGPTTGGTAVTLTGTGLAGASAVDFGTNAGTVTADTATSITVLSPPGTGSVQVTVTVGGVTSAGTGFSYTAASAPVITSVSPATGTTSGGTTVTITGTGLWSTSAVSFGSQPAFFTAVTATSVTATAPAGAVGAVDITVTTPAGTSAANPSADTFTYTSAPVGAVAHAAVASAPSGSSGGTGGNGGPAPALSSFVATPVIAAISLPATTGTGQQTVTITGSGLSWATQVDFGGRPVYFTNVTDSSITAFVPGGTGTVVVTVLNATGHGSVPSGAADFSYPS